MQNVKSLGCLVGLSMIAGMLAVAPAHARSYADITGTNIWNSTAPVLEGDSPLDPELITRIRQINQDADTAYRACTDAIAQAEQATSPTPRRYARQPAPAPPVPEACQRLETLRTEAETLRATVQQIQTSRSNPAYRTW